MISEELLDDLDMLTKNRQGYAGHYIAYADNGLVALEYYVDRTGAPVAVGGFSRRTLVSVDEAAHTYTMKAEDETQVDYGAAPYTLMTYDRYDRVIEEQYFDQYGQPTVGPDGSFMVQREYTSRGQISRIRYMDAAGNDAALNGVYGKDITYNSYGNIDTETWVDQNGQPTPNEDGYAGIRYDYDLSDSSRVERYFEYYLDVAGQPTQAVNGAWGVKLLYYPVTRIHQVTYIDADGKEFAIEEGYATLQYEENDRGNRVWEGYFDAIGAPVNCAAGYASKESGYDNDGRIISERYLDRYNKLTNNVEGVAGWNGYYTAEGVLVITSCYDRDRNQVPVPARLR